MDSPNAEHSIVEPKTPSQTPHPLLFPENPYHTPPSTYRRDPAAVRVVYETPAPLGPSKESLRVGHPPFSPPKFQTIASQRFALQKLAIEDDERSDKFSITDQVSAILNEREQRHGLVALFLQTFPSLKDDMPIRREFGDIVRVLLESDGSSLVLKGEALEAARNYFETLGAVYVEGSVLEKKRKNEETEEEESGPACALDVADGRTIVRKLFDDQNGEEHRSLW